MLCYRACYTHRPNCVYAVLSGVLYSITLFMLSIYNRQSFFQDFATVAVMLSHGRNSPPPNFRNHHRDDDDDDDDEDDEEDEEEYDDEGDDFEETKSPIAVSLPPPPLKSCLKSARKLTIRDDVIAESVDL